MIQVCVCWVAAGLWMGMGVAFQDVSCFLAFGYWPGRVGLGRLRKYHLYSLRRKFVNIGNFCSGI